MIKSIVRGSIVSLFAFGLAMSASHASAQSVITGTDPQPSSPKGPKSSATTSAPSAPSTADMVSLLLSLLVS